MRFLLLTTCLIACNGSALQNIPRANPTAVAGAAAAIAGAATLASPYGADRKAIEANRPAQDLRPQRSGPMVPADVLDRLDHAQR